MINDGAPWRFVKDPSEGYEDRQVVCSAMMIFIGTGRGNLPTIPVAKSWFEKPHFFSMIGLVVCSILKFAYVHDFYDSDCFVSASMVAQVDELFRSCLQHWVVHKCHQKP